MSALLAGHTHGNARYVDAFKYLGGVSDTTATWDKEIHLGIT
jgi:hypothetical protein